MKVPERKVIGNLTKLVYIYKNGVENPFSLKLKEVLYPTMSFQMRSNFGRCSNQN